MSKVYGLQGYLKGKLGNTVFAIRNGVQLARQYNPVVNNPKTAAQVANRGKLKLLSQLSASVASVIAMPRIGLVTRRNQFIRRNYPYTTYGDDAASIPMADILLTASYVGLPGFTADRSNGTSINVALEESASAMYDAVVWVVLKKTTSQAIVPAASVVQTVAGDSGAFQTELPFVEGDISVHAYGVKYNTALARTTFGDMVAPTAEDVAKVIVTRVLTERDATLSETRGLFLDTAEDTGETSGTSTIAVAGIVYNNATGETGVGGSVLGGGRVEIGTSVTLTAVSAEDFVFLGWKANPTDSSYLSQQATYTFTPAGTTTVYAIFRPQA